MPADALRDQLVRVLDWEEAHVGFDKAIDGIPADKRGARAAGFEHFGGLVAADSLKRGQGLTVEFAITDTVKTIPVSYTGILPDLFREGQGVVTEGRLDASGRFIADTVLAKHDENYMPPEVAKALKDQGMWQHSGPKAEAKK